MHKKTATERLAKHKIPGFHAFRRYRISRLREIGVPEDSSKFLNYDLDHDDIDDRCSTAGVDLTNVAEKELKDLMLRDVD